MSDIRTTSEVPHCYRCGNKEQGQQPLRLLPGSSHITLCPACYEVIWGWHPKPLAPASAAPREKRHSRDSNPDSNVSG